MMNDHLRDIRLVITGGGTGGHLFPGIAVGEAILSEVEGSRVLFIGTDRQVDSRVLGGRPFSVAAIRCQGLKGRSFSGRLAAIWQLPLAMWNSARILRKFRPDLVLGVGGYVTGPVVLAARLLGIPTAIHEQNSVPGLANRWLGRFVDRIFLSLPGSDRYFPTGRTVLSGNPVRSEILALAREKRGQIGTTLLVLGGSQGAHRLNQLVVEGLVARQNDLPTGFRVIHQTGSRDEELVSRQYRQAGIMAQVSGFFDDMAAIYRQADLVVSRAGATSLAELCVLGKPAILVPYPYAADNHQEFNAGLVAERGGALLYREAELNGSELAGRIIELLNDSGRLEEMGRRAREVAYPEATAFIVQGGLELIKIKKRRLPAKHV